MRNYRARRYIGGSSVEDAVYNYRTSILCMHYATGRQARHRDAAYEIRRASNDSVGGTIDIEPYSGLRLPMCGWRNRVQKESMVFIVSPVIIDYFRW